MDIFVEQIVKRKKDGTDYLKMIGIVVGLLVAAVALSLLVLGFYPVLFISVAFISLCGAFYLMYYFISGMNVEFEYSVTNGYVTVDKIIAKRKRKRLLTFESKEVEVFHSYDERHYQQKTFDYKVNATSNNPNGECWAVEVVSKDKGRSLLVFEPSQRVLKAIKPFLRRQVAFDGFGRN